MTKVAIITLKCIKCGKEAEYVVDGSSFCGGHLPFPEPRIETRTEQKPASFVQPESLAEPKKEEISIQTAPVPLAQEESKEKSEQKSTIFIQPPPEPKKEDIHAQASPTPLAVEARPTGKPEIPTKTDWKSYLIRTPIKEHWNYYLIIALLIVSVILFALYFTTG